MVEFEEDDEDLDDEPADDDLPSDEIPCPYCGQAVYEQAELCPHCRSYLSHEDAPGHRWPRWMWIGFLLALAGTLTWVGLHF